MRCAASVANMASTTTGKSLQKLLPVRPSLRSRRSKFSDTLTDMAWMKNVHKMTTAPTANGMKTGIRRACDIVFGMCPQPAPKPPLACSNCYLFGCEAHRLNHLVARLNVIELRLEQCSLGIELLRHRALRLGLQRLAFLQLLRGYAAGFRAQRIQFFRDLHHFLGALQFVVSNLQLQLHVLGDTREIFFRFRHFRLALTHGCASLAAIEKIVSKINAKGAEVAGQKRNVALIAVASEGRYVRHIVSLR